MKYTNSDLIEIIAGCTTIDNEAKSQLIYSLKQDKKFGLLWEDSTEDAVEKMRSSIPLIQEDQSKHIGSSATDAPDHIIIEGDNLYALTALTYSHENKINVIYIDPPYNTGARDWRYNNEFVDENDTYRHSKWLSWINRRIRIAKRLLTDTGVIVVTIDDYEIAPLRMLMDEIFGIENYLGTIVIRNNPSGRSTVRGLSVNHEYALLYSKTQNAVLGHMPHNDDQKSRYGEKDSIGYYEWENFRKNGTDSDRKDRPKQFYPLCVERNTNKLRVPTIQWDEDTKSYNILESISDREIIVWPCTSDGTEKVWKYGLERTRTIVDEILVKQTKSGIELYRKKYLNTEGSLPRTWWDKPEYSARDNGTRTLTNIFGPTKVFDFPKAPEAVKDALIAANLKKDGIVLDFFGGSGTTLHATMMMNEEDGGHRQCILVSNNENNICEEVTYERNRRIIEGYTMPSGKKVEPLSNNSLRYFRTIFADRHNTHQSKKQAMLMSTDLIRVKEGCFEEMTHFGGLSLSGKANLLRYFTNDSKKVLLVYEPRVIPFLIEEIKQIPTSKDEIKIFIFADGSYPYTEDFKDVLDKVTLIAMPFAIAQSMKQVMPLEDDTIIDKSELSEEEQAELIRRDYLVENNEL